MRPLPRRSRLALGALLATLAGAGARAAEAPPASFPRLLARVPAGASLADLRLPVYAHLRGTDGVDYALVFAPAGSLAFVPAAKGLASAARPEEFVVATERRRGARSRSSAIAEVVLDDGRHVVARADESQAEALAAVGFDLVRLPATPIAVASAAREPMLAAVSWDPTVAALVAAVTEAAVSDLDGGLSGAHPVTVGGAPVTIATRHTGSGASVAQATQYAFEHFAASGLSPAYHAWTKGTWSGRNVVADLPGTTRPSEIVILSAHIDDMPPGSTAPGADDDASGSTGVLLAARALAGTRFERTIRFVLFTGEEQGLYGSDAYATSLLAAGANVVAVLNLDMIGWDGIGTPTVLLHTRPASNPGYAADAAIAETFRGAATLYAEGALQPLAIADGESASDHSSFWNRGFSGVLAIEDDISDFSPYYHTTGDTLATLDLAYFTAFVRTAVATAAHLGVLAPRPAAFLPLTPCRIVDTRDAGRPAGFGPPALVANGTRAFAVPSVCGVPEDAVAIAVNATAVDAAAAGWVTLFPGVGPPPGTSSVHFQPGRIRSCFSVLPLAPGAVFSSWNASAGSLHLVLDVVGAFR